MNTLVALENYIRVYPNMISEENCKDIISRFERHKEGQVVGGTYHSIPEPAMVKETKPPINIILKDWLNTDIWKDVDGLLYGAVVKAFKQYRDDVPATNFLISEVYDTGYIIAKYEQGKGEFLEHIDSAHSTFSNRCMAVVVYLNTVEEGGETHFRDWDIKIKSVAGSIIIFPAGYTHVHQGCIPISGHKYVSVTFMCI